MAKKAGKVLAKAAEKLLGLVYPERCVFCDRVIPDSDGGICPSCRGQVHPAGECICMKCGRLLSEKGEAAEEFCPACYGRSHSFEQGRVLYPYTDRVSESIYRFKYGGRERYAWFYGRWIYERYAMEINAWKPDALIPVPLHPSRMRDRGYNQAELIARRLSSLTGIPVRNDIVARSRKTAPQKLLGAEERRRNLKNAFKICQYDVKLETIVLIDDIYTTGSTVDEIGALLKSAGVSRVYVLVVAAGVAQ